MLSVSSVFYCYPTFKLVEMTPAQPNEIISTHLCLMEWKDCQFVP